MRLVELSRSAHAGLRIRPDRVEASAATQHLIPIVAGEFRKAAIQYPIVFVKSSETGRFSPYVLTGLDVEENLFWSGTELDVAYVPLNVRRQPFYVGTATAVSVAAGTAATSVLCIDLDSPCVDPSGQKGILNSDGTDSAYLQDILTILGELVAGKEPTDQFIEAALALDLLTPIMLDIALADRTPLRLAGLYGLDEERFRQLDEQAILKLRQAGHLDLIYSVLIATGQIFNLIRLKNQRLASSHAWHKTPG